MRKLKDDFAAVLVNLESAAIIAVVVEAKSQQSNAVLIIELICAIVVMVALHYFVKKGVAQ